MSLPWITIAIGIISVLCALYTGYEAWKKRQVSTSIEVVSSAVQLLKPYKLELAEVTQELAHAKVTIRDLETKLSSAEVRAERLNMQLDGAHAEINYLRAQIRILTTQVNETKD